MSSNAYPISSPTEIIGTGGTPGTVYISDGTNAIELRAPTGLIGDAIFELPPITGVANQLLIRSGATGTTWATAPVNQGVNTWHVSDTRTSGTNGGSFFSGAWRLRELNTITSPGTSTDVTLSSNQITIQDGIYWLFCIAPGKEVDEHKVRLQNITDATTVLVGTSSDSGSNQVNSMIMGYLTVTSGPKVFEVQHQSNNTREVDGFGRATGISGFEEIYTIINFIRLRDLP